MSFPLLANVDRSSTRHVTHESHEMIYGKRPGTTWKERLEAVSHSCYVKGICIWNKQAIVERSEEKNINGRKGTKIRCCCGRRRRLLIMMMTTAMESSRK